jgi:hypothetical protein
MMFLFGFSQFDARTTNELHTLSRIICRALIEDVVGW